MRTYRFTNNGIEYVIEAKNLTAALTEYRRRLKETT